MPDTNITPEMQAQFAEITSGEQTNLALFSCFLDGKPTAAIVSVTVVDEEYRFTPLFVSVTPEMALTDHEGREAIEV